MNGHETTSGHPSRPSRKGDRIERTDPVTGARKRGTVHHVDAVQILVKWDDGSSENLDPEVDGFRIVEAA